VAAGLATARDLGGAEVASAIEAGTALSPAALAASGELPFPCGAAGYVLDSLTLAVAAVLDRRPLADVVVDIARLGNDADTNAAIAGGLLGARDGADAIPHRWARLLQFGAEFVVVAGSLAARRLAA
jgi:ADP-ribosylglycohydrolase